MLLGAAEGSSFPVRHLLTLTHLLVQQVLGHLGKARLVRSDANLSIVRLCIDEVGKELVELHGWEVSGKHIQVALERESNA